MQTITMSENSAYLMHHFTLPIRTQATYDSLRENISNRNKYFPFKHLYGITKSISRKLWVDPPPPVSDLETARVFMQVLQHLNVDKQDVHIIVFKMDDHDKINNQFVDMIDSLAVSPEYRGWNISTIRLKNVLTPKDYFILDDHINAEGHRKIAAKMAESLNPVLH
jgi:hypothetical protein